MADIIDYEVHGNDMQLVEVELDPGEGVRAETGAMCFMEEGIEMQTTTGGGLFKGFKRMLTGEGFFISSFVNGGGDKAKIGFAAPYPGRIIPLQLGEMGGEVLCQKDAFLCAAAGTEIDIAFTKRFGVGLFGGEGFILQRLTGDGWIFLHAGGTIIHRTLAPGETLRVDTGCLVALTPNVKYDIQFVGGFKNSLFGGEGLFFATVRGPGAVFLQSLPFSRLADRVKAAARLGGGKGETKRGGGLVGDILGGD